MKNIVAIILIFSSFAFATQNQRAEYLQDKIQLEQLIKTASVAVEACDDHAVYFTLTDLSDFRVQTAYLDLKEEALLARVRFANQVAADGFSGRCTQ